MSIKFGRIKVCDLEVQTVKRSIKNIHLGVYPPNGKVRVAAPLNTSDEAIKLLILSKMHWINKQKSKFAKQERQTKREYVSGESHYFMGRRYLLNVICGRNVSKVEIKRKNSIDLYVREGTTLKKRERLLDNFYRLHLRNRITSLLPKWEHTLGVKINEVRIKKMKTKWGTSNQKHRRIWINLELAKKPTYCLEYVIAHELAHSLEKRHNERFRGIMDSAMPQWKAYKDELNLSTLGYSPWNR